MRQRLSTSLCAMTGTDRITLSGLLLGIVDETRRLHVLTQSMSAIEI